MQKSFAYPAVNTVLCDVFFDGRFRLLPLYLDLEGALVEDVASRLSVSTEECTDAIAAATAKSLCWTSGNPFARHLDDLRAWDELGRFEPPPCIALLCTLVIAAERMRTDEVYSAHNYYERLFEVLGVCDETNKTKLRHHAKSTLTFWVTLNQWLAEHEHEFGRPTAKRVNEWPYVSYALSQALVRDADRQRFHRMFAEVGFRPGEQLTDHEMLLYLDDWIRGASASSWLKKLWSVPDLRGRVAQAACGELEQWTGGELQDAEGTQRHRTLNWTASIVSFPQPRLQLYLSAAATQNGVAQRVELVDNPSPAAREAFRDCADGLWMADVPGADFAVLEPIDKIAIRPLLLGSFHLNADQSLLTRVARPLVPLLKLETGPYYRETSRVSLLMPHLILCHEQWQERVDRYLQANARAGYKLALPEQLPGLPSDWRLFKSVELLRRPDNVPQDLEVLAPLAEGVSLNFDGGLRLAQGLWHSEQPPELIAAASAGNVSIELRENSLSGGMKAVAKSDARPLACSLSLADVELPSAGDFTVVALQDGKVRSESALSVRSADRPRRINPALDDLVLSVRPGAAQSLLAGLPGPIPDGLPALKFRGLSYESCGEAPEWQIASMGNVELALPSGDELGADTVVYVDRDPRGLGESCVLRGHHYWLVEAFTAGDDPYRPRKMRCRDCDDRVLFKSTRKAKKGPAWTARPAAAASHGPKLPPKPEQRIDADQLFDAICYLGSGKWNRLMGLAAEASDEPWFPARFGENLRQLGHIDVLLDSRSQRPETWVCAPPTVVATNGGGYLAGFRSAELISEIAARLRPLCAMQCEVQEDAPPILLWRSLTVADARHAIAGLKDPVGREIKVSPSPALALATFAPPISAAIAIMRDIHVEAPSGLQLFNVHTGKWNTLSHVAEPGAYRISFAGTRYFYRFPDGQLKEGSYELVKLLAAREHGLRLHSYDPQSKRFFAVLGCPPPGLLTRALVSCSGQLPVREGGRQIYGDVPPDVAQMILTKLY
jgi:hypothetical protein